MAMVFIVKPYRHKMKHPVIHSSKGKKYKKYKVPFNQGNIPERYASKYFNSLNY